MNSPILEKIGASGIDIFFVISGFVIAYVTRSHRGNYDYASTFIRKRIIRVVPVYWVWTTLFVVLLIAAPHLFRNSVFELRGMIFSYLMLPYTPTESYYAPILPVGWTLWFEMYFYCLVACGLIFKGRTFLIILGVFFAACIAFRSYLPFTEKFVFVMTNPLLFECWVGFAIGLLFSIKGKLPVWIPYLILFCAVILYLMWLTQIISLHLAFPSVFLVAGIVLLEKNYKIRFPKLLVTLGDSSYSLYLTNFFIGPAVVKILLVFSPIFAVPPDAYVIFATALCIVVGYFAYLWVELPITGFLRQPGKIRAPQPG